MQHLTLYSTSHCSLCEQALNLLFSTPGLAGVQLQVVDVADDDALLERYGEKSPCCVSAIANCMHRLALRSWRISYEADLPAEAIGPATQSNPL